MEEATLDAALQALGDGKRRDVLRTLLDNGPVVIGMDDDSGRAAMVHNHLPKLADLGFVEYTHDGDGIEVEKGPRWDEYRPLVEHVLNEY